MKHKILLAILAVTLAVQPMASMLPAGTVYASSATGTSGKKLNLISNAQCLVQEPSYNPDDSLGLTPGDTFDKDPSVKSVASYNAYCFVRVEVPTATFTTENGNTVVSDVVQMLSGGNEGINTDYWEEVGSIINTKEAGTNSVYVFQYTGANGDGLLASGGTTETLFDSMMMPSTVEVDGATEQVASVESFTGSVVVQGFLVSTDDAADADTAYSQIYEQLMSAGDYSSNSSVYDSEQQGVIDTLTKEKLELQDQVDALEERLGTDFASGVAVGDAKASDVLATKIFSNAEENGIVGTMPDYSTAYSYTDDGYQKEFDEGTGLVRNDDGTITIEAGYHTEQVLADVNATFTVSFDKNGKAFGSMDDQTIVNGAGDTLSANTFTKAGYTFTGWNTEADGSGFGYPDQSEIEHNGTGTVTLYAQWEPNTYTISFDGNGSTYGAMSDQQLEYDETSLLKANTYYRDGYTFVGWAETSDGVAVYADQEAVRNLATEEDENVTLYAVWEVQSSDVSGEDTAEVVTHTHVWVSKYDETSHWEQCTMCSATRNVQEHAFETDYWTLGSASNCSEANHHYFVCDCGYSYYDDSDRAEHTFNRITSSQSNHNVSCSVCRLNKTSERHYYHDEDGNIVYLVNDATQVGTCEVCGRQYKGYHSIYSAGITYPNTSTVFTCEAYEHASLPGNKFVIENFTIVDDYTAEFDIKYTLPSGYTITTVHDAGIAVGNGSIVSQPHEILSDTSCVWHIQSTGKAETDRTTTEYKVHAVFSWENPDGTVSTGYGYYTLPYHFNYPEIDSITSAPVSTTTIDGETWSTSEQFTISGTETYNSTVNITVKDTDGNTYVSSATAKVADDDTWTYSFVPSLEASSSGRTLEVTVANDRFSTTEETTVSLIDGVAPVMTNADDIDYSGEWATSRAFTITATDYGAGGVQIGINHTSDMTLGTVAADGNTYTKKYTYGGDSYDDKILTVFLQDAAGNFSQYDINIGLLDNTAPVIQAVTVDSGTATITYGDYNTTVKAEGSGVSYVGYCSDNNSSITWVTADSTESTEITGLTSGDYYFYAKDAVGNQSAAFHVAVG